MPAPPPDARINKLLTAFNIQSSWPELYNRQGVRTILDFAKLSDHAILQACPLNPAQLTKLKTVLNRVAQAASVKAQQTGSGHQQQAPPPQQQPRAGRAAPAPPTAVPSNPFGAPQAQPQPSAAAAAPPPTASRRVLDLRPVEDDAAPPPRPPKTVQKPAASQMSRKVSKGELDLAQGALPIVVHEGWMTKVGGKVKSWQKRYFVLRSDGTLTYSKEGALSDNKGAIDLKEATSLNGPGQCNWVKEDNAPKEATPLLRIEILTSLRTFKMFATDSQAAAVWAEKLEMVRQHAKSHANVKPPGFSDIADGIGYQKMLAQLAAVNA